MDLGHVAEMFVVALGGSVPVLLYIMSNKKQAKADAETRQAKLETKIDGVVTKQKYFPSHRHKEDPGQALMSNGIQYPPED